MKKQAFAFYFRLDKCNSTKCSMLIQEILNKMHHVVKEHNNKIVIAWILSHVGNTVRNTTNIASKETFFETCIKISILVADVKILKSLYANKLINFKLLKMK